ncbi:hypothetical protein C6B32_01985 [Campylobacter fetus subsp. testudinum]|nr:hypothetical protein C6B32_01985 [Campylobacter fetus subsp. testudinum]
MYAWVAIVGFVGGIIGAKDRDTHKGCLHIRCAILKYIIAGFMSMYICYIAFELAFFWIGNMDVAIAIAGIAAFMGTNALITLQELITNLTKGNKYDKS